MTDLIATVAPNCKLMILMRSFCAVIEALQDVLTYLVLSLQAFGWAYVDSWHDTWEQFYVYWICPFLGAILAAWVFRVFFPPQPQVKKQKKA